MKGINRVEVNEFGADSTIVEAGDFVYIAYCMGNEGKSSEEQIAGAFDLGYHSTQCIGVGSEH